MRLWVRADAIGDIISHLQDQEVTTRIKIVNYLDMPGKNRHRRFMIDLSSGQVAVLNSALNRKTIEDAFGAFESSP